MLFCDTHDAKICMYTEEYINIHTIQTHTEARLNRNYVPKKPYYAYTYAHICTPGSDEAQCAEIVFIRPVFSSLHIRFCLVRFTSFGCFAIPNSGQTHTYWQTHIPDTNAALKSHSKYIRIICYMHECILHTTVHAYMYKHKVCVRVFVRWTHFYGACMCLVYISIFTPLNGPPSFYLIHHRRRRQRCCDTKCTRGTRKQGAAYSTVAHEQTEERTNERVG